MRVTLIATTRFNQQRAEFLTGQTWEPDTLDEREEASALTEFAGRACYQSWRKPNPDTATNEGYLRNIIRQEHYSVMEHGSATFYVEDVSRSLTHELVRHRHLSYSQLSQRYVTVTDDTEYVIPPLFRRDFESEAILAKCWERAVRDYEHLVSLWMPKLLQDGYDAHKARKMAREAARAVLPNMTPTAIVVTGNHRAWREMLCKRATIHADAEIRKMALLVYARLVEIEPSLYQDFRLTTIEGQEILVNGVNS